MACEQYREGFEEYLSNILDPGVHDRISGHVKECPECAGVLEQFRSIREDLMRASHDLGLADDRRINIKRAVLVKVREMESLRRLREKEFVKAGAAGKLTGTTLENYEIYEEIGHGGMGTVYRAKQISMDRIVALKVLNEALAEDEKFVNKFLQEARAAGKLNHLNMITVHHVGAADGRYFFAMEYVDGETVQEQLNRGEIIPAADAVRIGLQIVDALKYAHSKGIIHRDVKPDNIMLERMGIAKLADLGIALSVQAPAGDEGGARKVVGTPHYMSPEQARGQDLDFRSDIYSLGATLFHMVTGETPFKGATPVETMKLRLTGEVPGARARNAQVPEPVDHLVKRMMAVAPEDRFRDYDTLLAAMHLAVKAVEAPRLRTHAAGGRGGLVRKLMGVSIGAAAAIVLIAAWMKFGDRLQQDGPSPAGRPTVHATAGPGTPVAPGAASAAASSAEKAAAARAQAELDALLTKVEAGEDPAAAIALLEDFAKTHPGVGMDVIRTRIDAAANTVRRGQIDALIKEAVAAILPSEAQDDFGAGLALLERDFKPRFAELKADKVYADLEREYTGRAFGKFKENAVRAEQFLGQGAYDEAGQEIELARRLHVAGVDQAIDAFQARIVKTRDEAVAARGRETAARTAALRAQFRETIDPLLARRNFTEAQARCAAFKRNPDFFLIDAEIDAVGRDIVRLAGLNGLAEQAVRGMIGKVYAFRLAGGTVQKALVRGVEGGMINLEAEGGSVMDSMPTFGLKFDLLAFDEILRLAQTTARSGSRSDDYFALFLGCLLGGQPDEAERMLAVAEKLGAADAPRGRAMLVERRQSGRENEAQALVDEILAMAEKKRFAGFAAKAGRLQGEFADTACYARNKAAIDQAADACAYAAQSDKMADFFTGRVAVNETTIQVAYKFDQPAQLNDWRPVFGSWETTDKGLKASIPGEFASAKWMYFGGFFFPVRFSGEMKVTAIVELGPSASWQSCGLILGPYRLELPRFGAPEHADARSAGLAKIVAGGQVKDKRIDFIPAPGTRYVVSLATIATADGKNILEIRIGDFTLKLELEDGLPADAVMGLFNAVDGGQVFSDVTVQGQVTKDVLAAITGRDNRRKDFDTRLASGQAVSLFDGKSLDGWIPAMGIWEVRDGRIHAAGRGVLLYETALKAYELTAVMVADPSRTAQSYPGKMHLACGARAKGRFLRAGFFKLDIFTGWEIGDGFNMRERVGRQAVEGEAVNKILQRDRKAELKVRFTKEAITILLDGEEVLKGPNPCPDEPTAFGLMLDWGEFYFESITVRKL